MDDYFGNISKEINKALEIANDARKKGYDPEDNVEILLAANMAERVVGLISSIAPQVKEAKIDKQIMELEKKYGFQDWRVAFDIALEVAQEKFCKFKDKKEAAEVGLRTGLAYLTNGVVASPLEGFTRLELKKTKKGKEYFALYFSGPIRSAGTTAVCAFVVLADYVRKNLGYAEYDPREEEIKRMVTELNDFHDKVTNLQYMPSEKEIEFMTKHLPVQICGEATEKFEVSNYKDLERVETNVLSNGVCLVMGEGLTQKAAKFWSKFSKWCKDYKMNHWNFLEKFIKIQKKIRAKGETEKTEGKIAPDYGFIKDLVAGRPVFTYPLAKGGFRLRYGRCRNSGFSSQAISPITMTVVDNFIATGTQLKVERPGKAAAISVCDSIEGPIVKLKSGDIIFLEDVAEAEKYLKEIEEILYLGDILINYGDFLDRGHVLVPPGYCEEWWMLEAGSDKRNVDVDEAIKLCKEKKAPLHPRYTFHWKDISKEQFTSLINWLKKGQISEKKIIVPFVYDINLQVSDNDPKRVLELLGVPHRVVAKENVIIEGEWAKAFLFSIGETKAFDFDINGCEDVLGIVNKLSGAVIKDKSGTFIGARMGRPEKAKMRKMTGSPQVLFSVGKEGGRLRCFQSALEKGKIKAQFPLWFCEKCNKETIYRVCCGEKTKKRYYCSTCDSILKEPCKEKDHKCTSYKNLSIDIKRYFEEALKTLGVKHYPELIKGVRGTSNEDHTSENIAKGIFRAMNKLYVNKDGTIRYDMTEIPITHFKPIEIRTPVEKLRELGYEKDIHGEELRNPSQILELKPQDIILPACPESMDEKADDVLFNIAKFIDELLVKLYKIKSYYNLKDKNDLVGQLVIAMSPHTSAGIVGRIIGFSKTQGLLAHPNFHSIMRRDCLGYNNYVSVENNEKWGIEKIGEFIENINPEEKADNFGTLKKNISNVNVWSNPGKRKILEVTKHQPRKMLKIFLEDGRKIELTENHKVFIKGKKLKKANTLKLGDKLMVCYKRNIKEKDIKEIFLPEIFKSREDVMLRNIREYLNKFENIEKHKNFWQRNSFPITFVKKFLNKYNKTLQDLPSKTRIAIKRDDVSIPIKIPLKKELLEVIGLYIAEGYSRKKNFGKGFYHTSIAAIDKDLKRLIKKVFSLYFNLNPSEDHEDHLTFSSRILYELFNDYLKVGSRAKNKRIPNLFLNLKKNKLAALLRGYFEGDGSASLGSIRVSCDTVSEGLTHDLSFALSRFGIFTKFYEYKKQPGPKVREFYLKKGRKIPKFKITKVLILSNFVNKFKEIGFISRRKNSILNEICNRSPYGMKIDYDKNYVYPKVKQIEEVGEEVNYCFNVDREHNFFANDVLVKNCDGDEAGIMLMMDALLNFSKKYLPAHRGAKQDEPLVLTSKLIPSEVDNMVFNMDIAWKYPLEFYEAAMNYKYPWEINIKKYGDVLRTPGEYEGLGFTHDTENINRGVRCSAYKSLPTMQEKVEGQMKIAEKIRAVDEMDVARLVIERHFIRDIKGNLRKFSMQQFRCVECNEKYRRPPLKGVCLKCNGKLIFTIAEGSVVKYLEPSISLAKKYKLPPYLQQTLMLTQQRIESVFGKEKEKQEGLGRWFG